MALHEQVTAALPFFHLVFQVFLLFYFLQSNPVISLFFKLHTFDTEPKRYLLVATSDWLRRAPPHSLN